MPRVIIAVEGIIPLDYNLLKNRRGRSHPSNASYNVVLIRQLRMYERLFLRIKNLNDSGFTTILRLSLYSRIIERLVKVYYSY